MADIPKPNILALYSQQAASIGAPMQLSKHSPVLHASHPGAARHAPQLPMDPQGAGS